MCFGCSKEPSQKDGSFEYPQQMFWMNNIENSFPIHTLIWRPEVPKDPVLQRDVVDSLLFCFPEISTMSLATWQRILQKEQNTSR